MSPPFVRPDRSLGLNVGIAARIQRFCEAVGQPAATLLRSRARLRPDRVHFQWDPSAKKALQSYGRICSPTFG
jgi:hypothetical protein